VVPLIDFVPATGTSCIAYDEHADLSKVASATAA
jgi:hypothetical protein